LVVKLKNLVRFFSLMILLAPAASAQTGGQEMPAPADVKPGSVTCEECPHPYPTGLQAQVEQHERAGPLDHLRDHLLV